MRVQHYTWQEKKLEIKSGTSSRAYSKKVTAATEKDEVSSTTPRSGANGESEPEESMIIPKRPKRHFNHLHYKNKMGNFRRRPKGPVACGMGKASKVPEIQLHPELGKHMNHLFSQVADPFEVVSRQELRKRKLHRREYLAKKDKFDV